MARARVRSTKHSRQKVQAAAKAQLIGSKVKARMGKVMKGESQTKKSGKNGSPEPDEQGVELDETYPERKKGEKNKFKHSKMYKAVLVHQGGLWSRWFSWSTLIHRGLHCW